MEETRRIESPRNRRRYPPITTVDVNTVTNVTVNIFSNATVLIDYEEGYINCDDGTAIRCRIYKLRCDDGTEARIALFTLDNGAYYSAIEINDDWVEFTVLNSTRNGDTIRFNTKFHQHFYADEWILDECGKTPLSKMLLSEFEGPHIGESVVYLALDDIKMQGLI